MCKVATLGHFMHFMTAVPHGGSSFTGEYGHSNRGGHPVKNTAARRTIAQAREDRAGSQVKKRGLLSRRPDSYSTNEECCRSGGIGRRARLRAWLPLLAVQVQVLSPAPCDRRVYVDAA